MGEVLPMPAFGDLFTDVRGGDRRMRVSYHGDRGVVVVSLWAGEVCRGSFRMAAADVRGLIEILTDIEMSVGASTPGGAGPGQQAGAVAGDSGRSEPSVEETGDVGGRTNRGILAMAPVHNVA
jgi:hypothetical protein